MDYNNQNPYEQNSGTDPYGQNSGTSPYGQSGGTSPYTQGQNPYGQTGNAQGQDPYGQAAGAQGTYSQGQSAQDGGQNPYYQQSSYQQSAYQHNTYQQSAQNPYQQPQYQGYQSYQTYQSNGELEEPMSVKEWLIVDLLMLIPCVNLILVFVWAFSSGEKKSKSNFFKANLIFAGCFLGFYVLLLIIAFAAGFASVFY